MGKQGQDLWRCGYDGLLVAIIHRAYLDWQGTGHLAPDEAGKLAEMGRGNTLLLDTCRFAVEIGFPSPTHELAAFFENGWLWSLLDLCGIRDRMLT